MHRKIFAFPLLLLALYLLQINLRLYHQPTIIRMEQGVYDQDLYHQLRYLSKEMHAGAGEDMQKIYPESHYRFRRNIQSKYIFL